MTYIVSITSQGQISIPAPLRRKLGLDRSKKALVSEQKGKILVEPVGDLLELKGSFKSNLSPSVAKIRQEFKNYLAKKGRE